MNTGLYNPNNINPLDFCAHALINQFAVTADLGQQKATVKFPIEGPRAARFGDAISQATFLTDVECTVQERKRLFICTWFVRLEGPADQILSLLRGAQISANSYNA